MGKQPNALNCWDISRGTGNELYKTFNKELSSKESFLEIICANDKNELQESRVWAWLF